MARWTRDRLPVAVGLVLVVGALGWILWAYLVPPDERGTALALPGFVVGLVGVLVSILQPLVRLGQRATARSAMVLADRLADAVDGPWREEAFQRRLLPGSIPLRWSLSDLVVAGPITAAVGTPGAPPAFEPLPGYTRTTESDLQAGGGRSELHAVYAGLASGRIVVVGAPGSGKSGTAILLLLDALTHRSTLNDPRQRARVPVPVLLTVHGWNPIKTSAQKWLADRLAQTYPRIFAHRGGFAEATKLATRNKVALLLDGLDEMDASLRPTALEKLSEAPFRVVVFTRSQEMVRAASMAWLTWAVAVHLQDVIAVDAANYLQHALNGRAPAGWEELLSYLKGHPDGGVAHGLSNPLALTLIRDTYHPDDDVRDLIRLARSRPPDVLEQHLIARVLPAAYKPDETAPRYTEQQARQTLSFLAQQMGTNRDFAWWHILRWSPALPRTLATGLGVGLMGALTGWFAIGLMGGFAVGLTASILVFGLMTKDNDRPQLVRAWRATLSHQAGRTLRFGIAVGIGIGIPVAIIVGLIQGLADGLMAGLMPVIVSGFAAVVSVGEAFVDHWSSIIIDDGLEAALGLPEGSTDEGSALHPQHPHEVWRNEPVAALGYGLMWGLFFGATYGLISWIWLGVESAVGLKVGLVVGLWTWFAVALGLSTPWAATLAWLQLWWSGHVSAVGLMPFLEDARKRNVLRTVGAVYQFRHATLQDHLASQATSNSTPFAAGLFNETLDRSPKDG